MRKPPEAKYRPCLVNGKRIPHTSPTGVRTYRIDHPMLKTKVPWANRYGEEAQLATSREAFRYFVDTENWAEALGLLEEKARFPYLLSVVDELSAETFYGLLKGILTTNETLRSLRNPLGRHFAKVDLEKVRPLLMSPAELRYFRKLPREFTVWRGTGDFSLGWAWTSLGEDAQWYASHYASGNTNQQGFLLKGCVQAVDVIAAFIEEPTGFGTLIVDPEKVHVLKVDVVGSMCPYVSPEERWQQIQKSRGAKPKAQAASPASSLPTPAK